MKFFKNSFVVENFFKLFPGRVIETYNKTQFKSIAEDFGLSKRISKSETIVRHIKEIDNPKQYMLDKLVEERERRRIEQLNMSIDQMSITRLRDELKHANIILEGNPDEMRQHLRNHRNSTLEWVAYNSNLLKSELDARHINRDKLLEKKRTHSRVDDLRYREHVAELLDLYYDGELCSEDFENVKVYNSYVTEQLKAFNLSTDGPNKQLRLVKYVLKKRDASLKGNIKQLLERLLRFQEGTEYGSDMTPVLVKKRLGTYGGSLGGTFEEINLRLDRFKNKAQSVFDYSDDWLREQLEKYEAPTTGNRQQLLERHRIIYLSEENARLRKELEDCHRRRRNIVRPRQYQKKSSGPGFYTGLAVGALGAAMSRRVQNKTTLKF